MNRRMLTASLLSVALLCGVLATNASANTRWEVTLTVPQLDPQPNGLRIQFQNTGGIKAVTSKSQNIATIGCCGEGGAEVDITLVGKLPPGTRVTFNFEIFQAEAQAQFGGGIWSNDGNFLTGIDPADVLFGHKFPGLGTVGLVLLSLLTLGSGVYVLSRRQTAMA